MAFPPNFLDELRARLPLAPIIQRRVRLVRKGREYSGLCPFHNEKSPSFTVNEDKGFYHCFGCGAHGDIIGFVMQAENRSFVEAVELLAAEAGLAVPQATPQAKQEAARQATLHDVTEKAAQFFQAQLRSAAGAEALAYLERRGVSAAMIERFRIGYAPSGNTLLKSPLLQAFPEPLLVEAGLLGYREGEAAAFDYFRQRIMFPIADRQGRVIAFGGRVLGDAKPKYLNSPETPIFQKGSVLYGMAFAREAARTAAPLIVTEGYLDVVALHQAGFAGAVAPLGTALTEAQLGELWKLSAEPILCFDGDAAGGRAAVRALDRALPLLKPGRSLRFVRMPEGDDPDTFIRSRGAAAMQALIETAMPLGEFVWSVESGALPVKSPERRADLAARLVARAMDVADPTLRREYQFFFRNAVFERLRPPRCGAAKSNAPPPQILPPSTIGRQQALIAVVLEQPQLLDALIEDFAEAKLSNRKLDNLRRAIIDIYSREIGLDANSLRHHLSSAGLTDDIAELARVRIRDHVRFAASGEPAHIIAGWRQVLGFLNDEQADDKTRTDEFGDLDTDLENVVARVNALQGELHRRRQAEDDLLAGTEPRNTT